MAEKLQNQLTDLLKDTGQGHHKAFAATDGADEDWPWYAERLMLKRSELVESLQDLNREIVAKQDCSITDAGEAAALREFKARASGIAAQHNQTIMDIDRALQKIEAGSYGVCEETGEPIPYERLRLIPWTRTGLKG